VIATQAVPATEASRPAMILEEEIDPRALRALTMVVDEDVEAIATLTDTAGELEGELTSFSTYLIFLTHLANLRSKPAMAGVPMKVVPNLLTSRRVKL